MILSETTIPTALKLKNNTAHHHQLLEELLVPHLQNSTTNAQYGAILKTFYGFFKPMEVLLEQYVDVNVMPDLTLRRKAALILTDLDHLNITGYPVLAVNLPHIINTLQALGAMYVLEGSTLGGRGITKMMLKNNSALTLSGLNFFAGYGADTGPKWVAFQNIINGITNEEDVMQMVTAANDTFLKFKLWILQSIGEKGQEEGSNP
jgi:heme oxygenase